ncbi:MAG: hypothetical protein IKB02_02560, partial [Clostridia bacterium]|nr:hypothetical protein [Clostridia bacterium]
AIDIYYFNSGRAITASGVFFDEPIGFSVWNAPRGLSQATSTAGGHDFKANIFKANIDKIIYGC